MMPMRVISQPRFDAAAFAILLATAALVRVGMGYRSFPSIDDFTYIPLGWAKLDPSVFPRDDILRGYVNHVPLWPVVIGTFERVLGLAEGLFLLTILLTLQTVYFLRQLLRSLGGTDLVLPLAVAMSVIVNVRGIGRGSYDGVLGDAFHMQWMALALMLGAYFAFVREKPIASGVYLGAGAWVHPLVAMHGAFCIMVAGLLNRRRGLWDTAKAGVVALLISLPMCVALVRDYVGRAEETGVYGASVLQGTVLFRGPHHFDIGLLPFLIAALLGLLALAALPRVMARPGAKSRRYYGLLLGQTILLLATFYFHGPFQLQEEPSGGFLLYSLDLSRTTPLFFALCGCAVAAGVPRPDEPLSGRTRWGGVDRVFAFSGMLGVAYLLFLNLKHHAWTYALLILMVLGYAGVRFGIRSRWATMAWSALAVVAFASFLRTADLRAEPQPQDAGLYSWVEEDTPDSVLFVIPPGMQAFRLETRRSVYVDFKSFPPSQPALAWEWRRRLEEIVDSDARALEQARGWPGVFWWDVAYAKRNPPERIASLLVSTGADFLVQDRLYVQLPPHLPIEPSSPSDAGLVVAFENERYRVYRLAQSP
jgi:hypothetical protein